MAAGIAVLDVIAKENLQENARILGERLMSKLTKLMAIHKNIGDVRGIGLTLGIEFIRDGSSLAPFPELAKAVAQRLADLGFLVTIDGIFKSVIKIKPPMCFTSSNVDQLVHGFDQVLTELERTPLIRGSSSRSDSTTVAEKKKQRDGSRPQSKL